MTAMPSRDGQSMSLVCDTCGQALNDIETPVTHWSVVWAVVSRTGWSGSPLAIGPHQCPHCSAFGALDLPHGDHGAHPRG